MVLKGTLTMYVGEPSTARRDAITISWSWLPSSGVRASCTANQVSRGGSVAFSGVHTNFPLLTVNVNLVSSGRPASDGRSQRPAA